VTRTRLVPVDEIVGFDSRKLMLLAQLGKTIPLLAVSGSVGVEIHLIE
jgi:hypothetical protein